MLSRFDRPLNVLVGLGTPRRLSGPAEALAFLHELPDALRDEAYEVTLAACREAVQGLGDPKQAYDILCAFARRRAIYVEDMLPERPGGPFEQIAA